MKRDIVFLFFFLLATNLFAQATDNYWKIGDVNGDTKIDIVDVVELSDIITCQKIIYLFSDSEIISEKNGHIYSYRYPIGDVNCDGCVNIADIASLVDIILYNKVVYLSSNSKITKVVATSLAGHEYVDLGLSVKWAATNIGAEEAYMYGKYYAWAESSAYGEEPSPYSESWTGNVNSKYLNLSTKTSYSQTYYKWMANYKITKYCSNDSYGTKDDIMTIEAEDDAAHVNWGSEWRMPTNAEWGELRNQCYWKWITDYKGTGNNGYAVFKVKNDSDKGKVNSTPVGAYTLKDTHIFLPATGHYYGIELKNANKMGYYWTSTQKTSSPYDAYHLYFSSSTCYREFFGREYGYPIRPVRP